MNIVIYYQNSYHTVFLESLVENFVQKGHKVFFLTTTSHGILHDKVNALGGQTVTYTPNAHKLLLYFLHWWYLIRFCRKNNINVVYSHLQYVNLIAVCAQYFIRARVIPTRHHLDDTMLSGNKNALLTDKLVNKLAKKLVVVAEAVKQHLIKVEHTSEHKISVIPLGYNFTLYDKPDFSKVTSIRNEMSCELLLIAIGRMNANKRHMLALQVLHQLILEGLNVKMLLLDRGEKEQSLRNYVTENIVLKDKVIFTGFLNNTIDYLAASDMLLHMSVSEASNQVVKEAGYLAKPSIVCKGVGDFEEYIFHEKNGFIVEKDNPLEETVALIKKYYSRKEDLHKIGLTIRGDVLHRFDIENTAQKYLSLLVS